MIDSGLIVVIILAVAGPALFYFQFFYKSASDRKLQEMAERGDVESMLKLAKKADTTKDRVLWYKRAADAGSTYGMVMFADYVSSLPDKKDLAFHYYLKAAKEGVPEAMAEVAEGYTNGNGVLKNIGSAAEWREKAAKKGHRVSQVELAKALFRGHGLTPQPAEGLAWLYLAEHNKAPEAALLVAEFETIARSYPSTTPNQIILDAQNRAKELLIENPSARNMR
jgi:TPR repeat protein